MRMVAPSPETLPEVARNLMLSHKGKKVFAFYGAMGAGKTTLIRAVCRELKVTDEVQSPTFSIVNEYKTVSGDSVFHFDFYRIGKTEEIYDIGYEDYMFSGSWCFIEWPEKAEGLLPEGTVRVEISGENERVVIF